MPQIAQAWTIPPFIERAPRRFLSLEVVDHVWERNAADPLHPSGAEQLAHEELRAARRQ